MCRQASQRERRAGECVGQASSWQDAAEAVWRHRQKARRRGALADDGRAHDALLVVERVAQQGGQLGAWRASSQVYINVFIYIQIHM